MNAYHTMFKKEMTKQEFCKLACKGWEKLINDLYEELSENGWNGRFKDIKEKFGQLRFDIEQNDSVLNDIINKYCEKATNTCIVCGDSPAEPGRFKERIEFCSVFCDKHRK